MIGPNSGLAGDIMYATSQIAPVKCQCGCNVVDIHRSLNLRYKLLSRSLYLLFVQYYY